MIFGTGPLGQAVMRELVKRGKPVRMVNRSGQAPAAVPTLAADVYNLDSARQAAQGATVVYQCVNAPYHQWPEKFPALQANIMASAINVGAKLIVADNLYMYGEVDGPLHEGLPNAAHTRKGRVRAQMAEAVLAAHQRGEVRVAIGRGSDFFGPGVLDSVAGERMFGPAVQGKAAECIGNIDLLHTYTFIDDFGRALVTLGEHDEALGQVWHVPNAETITTREFMALIFKELGLPPKITAMGRPMLWVGGLFIPAAREVWEMLYEFEKPFLVDHYKFGHTFGDLATPHREAIRQTLAWYRERLSANKPQPVKPVSASAPQKIY